LNELFEAYEDVYKRETYFIYGYLVVSLTMMKWFPPKGREITPVAEDQPLSLKHLPRWTSRDLTNKEINEGSFTGWYQKMLVFTKVRPKIPPFLLDEYSQDI